MDSFPSPPDNNDGGRSQSFTGPSKDVQNIHINMALQNIKLAKQYESQELFEAARKHYLIASNKLVEILRSETDPQRKEVFKKHAQQSIAQIGWLGTIINDKKSAAKANMSREFKPCKFPIGIGCLGSNYILAFDYYKALGDHYFKMATEKGFVGILPTVKKCFLIAGQNLKVIMDKVDNPQKKQMYMQQFNEAVSFAEQIQRKIQSDPAKYDVQKKYLQDFDEHEQAIIHTAAVCRDINYDLWSPALGITNIYNQQQFIDPSGTLPLSLKQHSHFSYWARLIDVLDKDYYVNGVPDVATAITGYEVKQKEVGDCSVLCSLAVTAHHEFKFSHQVKLISNNIYPQDQFGNPIYNPEGKYIVKLYLNGSWRAVEIDDYVPVSGSGRPIGAYSQKGKMWISLLEKAYLKAHGGYDFDGSLSSRDLFIFTGWLPENVDLKSCDKETLWRRIFSGYRNRDCLITCGTGAIEDEERLGLVSGHAYAVLEIMEAHGVRMLMLKNPWGHLSFKGKFSVHDEQSWTPQLKQAFNYAAIAAKDSGIFWIDLDTFVRVYDHLSINWNPQLLTYQKAFFDLWKAADMSQQDYITVKKSPQFQLQYLQDNQAAQGPRIVTWVAITKLLVKQNGVDEDAENAKDYLAMHVYAHSKPGEKTYNAGRPMLKSTYSNDQTIMVRMSDLDYATYAGTGKLLNLCLDQNQRARDLYFKVQIYSSAPFNAVKLGQKHQYKQQLVVPQLPISGGTPSCPFFYKNPQYLVMLDQNKFIDKAKLLQTTVDVVLTYEARPAASVKLYLCQSGASDNNQGHRGRVTQVTDGNVATAEQLTSAYKQGEFVVAASIHGAKHYSCIVSTYERSEPLGGTLTLESTQPMIFQPLHEEGQGMQKQVFHDEWTSANGGGCQNFGTYDKNPAYSVKLTQNTQVMMRLMISQELQGMNWTNEHKNFQYSCGAQLYRVQANVFPLPLGTVPLSSLRQPVLETGEGGKYSNSLSGCVSAAKQIEAGIYLLVPSTFNPQQCAKFDLAVYSSQPVLVSKYQ